LQGRIGALIDAARTNSRSRQTAAIRNLSPKAVLPVMSILRSIAFTPSSPRA